MSLCITLFSFQKFIIIHSLIKPLFLSLLELLDFCEPNVNYLSMLLISLFLELNGFDTMLFCNYY